MMGRETSTKLRAGRVHNLGTNDSFLGISGYHGLGTYWFGSIVILLCTVRHERTSSKLLFSSLHSSSQGLVTPKAIIMPRVPSQDHAYPSRIFRGLPTSTSASSNPWAPARPACPGRTTSVFIIGQGVQLSRGMAGHEIPAGPGGRRQAHRLALRGLLILRHAPVPRTLLTVSLTKPLLLWHGKARHPLETVQLRRDTQPG